MTEHTTDLTHWFIRVKKVKSHYECDAAGCEYLFSSGLFHSCIIWYLFESFRDSWQVWMQFRICFHLLPPLTPWHLSAPASCSCWMLNKAKNRTAPSYLEALITPCTASRFLWSASTAPLLTPSLRVHVGTASWLLFLHMPRCWRKLLRDVWTTESLAAFNTALSFTLS